MVGPPRFRLTRFVFLRLLALVYLAAFLSLGSQVHGLIGERGLLPAQELLLAIVLCVPLVDDVWLQRRLVTLLRGEPQVPELLGPAPSGLPTLGYLYSGAARRRTACYTWPMLRRVGPPALLFALGLASGVLVARLPPDLETTVVTRRHHGADPLLSAVLLRFGVDSLLHHPSRYFQPPFLFPDPNPLRGTEPLVAESLLAVPFRLALGDRPAAVFTWVKIATLALLTLGTGLMLKELGVSLGLCLLGGGLSVLVSTAVVFADRLQAVSLQ